MANNSVVTQEVLQNTLERYHEDFVYPYQNGATHTGFTPVGTVISYFGETAPEYFLICDGTEYAKSDYPQLADLLLNLTDPTPYEGSDSDHFKVPDLRGEFLRGSGTNSHTNQGSGANVGVHQNATESMTLVNWGAYYLTELKDPYATDVSNNSTKNIDTMIADGNVRYYLELPAGSFRTQSDATNRARYTSRPTNTSVLYCIAYKNIYIDLALDSFPLGISNPTDGQALVWNGTEGRWKNAGILHEYSTDENVVGTWIDGKPVYEKVLKDVITLDSSSYGLQIDISSMNIDTIIDSKCFVIRPSDGACYSSPSGNFYSNDYSANFIYMHYVNSTQAGLCRSNPAGWAGNKVTFIIQYTKTTDTV